MKKRMIDDGVLDHKREGKGGVKGVYDYGIDNGLLD